MAVQVWIGEKPDNPNERKAIIALANGLDRLEGLYVMIANFSVGGRAIDLVILKSDAIFIMELKHVDGQVFGSVNGKWKVVSKSGSTKELNPGRKNPYGQVVNYFYNFTNFLNDHKTEIVSPQKASNIDFRAAKRVIVLVPTVEPGSEIDLDWKVQVKGLDELPTYLLTERSSGIELSDDELQRIPKLLHCEPWQELNNLLAGVMPAWAATPSEPQVPLPPAEPEPPVQAPPPPAAPWWQTALRGANSWTGGVLTVFVLLALVWTLAALQPLRPTSNEPINQATIGPVPTIPEGGLPENVVNGVAEVHQRVARRWDRQQAKWIGADEESADILVTLETVDFNNGNIRLSWTIENRRNVPAKMALVPENIVIADNQVKYLIDATRSDPVGVVEVKRGGKQTATVVVPQAVRPNAITLKIGLVSQPFGGASWIVNVPQ
ncbi:MAG: NERD domain-containing protein [Chloroflexota bacterium]|nr:NERD domain-containing protein [Chloroflexota bacterium]PLS79281.1 MAG: nuclease [Chloroflexota bacterium]